MGEELCAKLRHIYHEPTPWITCFPDVAKKLSLLKKNAMTFYVDKDIVDVMKELNKFNTNDIKDMIETELIPQAKGK